MAKYYKDKGIRIECEMCGERFTKRSVTNKYCDSLCSELAARDRLEVWLDAHPEIPIAHKAVTDAVKSGALTVPDACEECGQPGAPAAHHENYFRPLAVEWLCRSCHSTRHGGLCRYERRSRP
jgi:hypothetical protein